MDSLTILSSTTSLVSLLDLCWDVVKHNSQEEVIKGERSVEHESTVITAAISKLVPLRVSAAAADRVLLDAFAIKFSSIRTRVLDEAEHLAKVLETKEYINFANDGEQWQEPGNLWIGRYSQIPGIKSGLLSCGSDLREWLLGILSDDQSTLYSYLKSLEKDASTLASIRGPQIATAVAEIRASLGAPKLEQTKRSQRRQRTSHSSDSLGSEDEKVRLKQRVRRTPAKRPRHGTSQSSASTEPLRYLRQVEACLQTLLHLARNVPMELRLLKQLSYESIDAREDTIHDAESGTFGWLLEGSGNPALPQHMETARNLFASWLNSGSGVFHISGRAGSGKSTLMKLLRHHPRTADELQSWAKGCKLVFSSFYFWNSGTPMQMSLEGLYRSILFEVLRQCPELSSILFPEQWRATANDGESTETGNYALDFDTIDQAFGRLRAQKDNSNHRICLFVDGLDEYMADDVDYRALARSLLDWSDNGGVKLCVSARPYPEFLEIFSPDLRLHLHDLTSEDIKAYVHTKFQRDNITFLSQECMDSIVKSVVEKSEGVFLWARVVVRALINSARQGMSEQLLLTKLAAYPAEIEPLYDHILGDIDPLDQGRSNQFLLLAARNPFSQPLNALWYSWLDELHKPDFPDRTHPHTSTEIKKRHERIRGELEPLSKDLLEMHADRRERKDGDQFYRQRVHFFHRTARDYLQSPRKLQALETSFSGIATSLTEVFAIMRLAELVLAGKNPVAPGADPRRRRIYLNYTRSLFSLCDDTGSRYQHPRHYLELLADDIRSTQPEIYRCIYAISGFRSVAKHDSFDEDPEWEASFPHFFASYGQYEYVLGAKDGDSTPWATQRGTLSLILAAAFGYRRWPVEQFGRLLRSGLVEPATEQIKTRRALADDPIARYFRMCSVLMVFVSVLAFGCLGEHRSKRGHGKGLVLKRPQDLFAMLEHILASVHEQNRDDASRLPNNALMQFICILRPLRQRAEAESTQERVLFTTMAEVARLYQPSVGDSAIADQGDAPAPLPSWAAPHVSTTKADGCTFISKEGLGNYYCTEIISSNEAVKAEEGLFYRIH